MALESSAGREGYSRLEPSSAPSPMAPLLLPGDGGLGAVPPVADRAGARGGDGGSAGRVLRCSAPCMCMQMELRSLFCNE